VIKAARGGIVDEAALAKRSTRAGSPERRSTCSTRSRRRATTLVRARPRDSLPHSAGLSKEAAIRMAISTAKNVLAGKLDPSMVVNREVLEARAPALAWV
jgi:D-3-phosphoglycerate dehydrogenase